jgi:hypothetical protein
MTQSRRMSLVEAATSVIVGYALSVGMQIVVFPVVGIHIARWAISWPSVSCSPACRWCAAMSCAGCSNAGGRSDRIAGAPPPGRGGGAERLAGNGQEFSL